MARQRVLVAAGEQAVGDVLGAALAAEGLEVVRATTATEALERALEPPVDAAVVALELPGGSGLAVLQQLRAGPVRHTPVLLLSARDDRSARLAAFAALADDVLPAAVEPVELVARLTRQLARSAEVTALAAECDRLRAQAATDGLTGLFNHRVFQERLTDEFRRAARYDDCLSLIVVGVDHFERIHDSWGQQLGDRVLRAVAGCVAGAVRETDFVARSGGADLAVLLPKTPLAGALTVAERIGHGVRQLVLPGVEATVTASFGLSAFPGQSVHRPEQLVRTADQALALAKDDGGDKIALPAQRLVAAQPGSPSPQ